MTGQDDQPEILIITPHDLAQHIDDPICICWRCQPGWHTGLQCNCPHCRDLRTFWGPQ